MLANDRNKKTKQGMQASPFTPGQELKVKGILTLTHNLLESHD